MTLGDGDRVEQGDPIDLDGPDRVRVESMDGLDKRPPDEFTVYSRAPLSLPPNYDLRPPGDPGAVELIRRAREERTQQILRAARGLGPDDSLDEAPPNEGEAAAASEPRPTDPVTA